MTQPRSRFFLGMSAAGPNLTSLARHFQSTHSTAAGVPSKGDEEGRLNRPFHLITPTLDVRAGRRRGLDQGPEGTVEGRRIYDGRAPGRALRRRCRRRTGSRRKMSHASVFCRRRRAALRVAGVASRGAVLESRDAVVLAGRRRLLVALETAERLEVARRVASGARVAGMSPRLDGEGVVERRAAKPRRRRPVTLRAVERKTQCPVVGIGRIVVVIDMAGRAVRGGALVNAVPMAVRAGGRRVLSLEREERVGE